VITGGVRSAVQVIVLDAVAVLPQPSMQSMFLFANGHIHWN
jgi:hypothetical protein